MYDLHWDQLNPAHGLPIADTTTAGFKSKKKASAATSSSSISNDDDNTAAVTPPPSFPGSGTHLLLHELIISIGAYDPPTHSALNNVWEKLPVVHGIHYPTETDVPDIHQRHAEMQRVMIVLYDRISAAARELNICPDALYVNGYLNRSANLSSTLQYASPSDRLLFIH
jgi:hypothetical protein